MRHLIVFCHLRWDFVQQRPQHLLTRLARHWPVHLVEEPMRGDGAPRLERTTPAPGIEVLRPQLPDGGRGFADDQFAVLKDLLHDHLRGHGIDDYVVWFYTPMALPRLGFFGVVDERLDLDLVDGVAAADPSWQLVMVGPVAKISADSLPRRPNIHWLGQQSYALLPQLVAGWDVCLLPFALNEATRFISPTKTLEYMAAEKPVVSTPVRDVALLYGRDVRIAGNVAAFVAACRDMLAESPEDRLARIRQMLATVARYSWDNTAQTMRSAIEQVIDARSTPEFRAATSS